MKAIDDTTRAVAAADRRLRELARVACTNSVLSVAARRLGHLYDEALAPIGLTAAQGRLLWQIGGPDAGGGKDGPTLQAVADGLGIQTSALTHALRPLMRDGMVALHQDAHDRRAKHAVLTPLGRERLLQMVELWYAVHLRVERALGPDSAAALRSLAGELASERFLTAYYRMAESDEAETTA